MADSQKIAARIEALSHAVQSGVRADMETDPSGHIGGATPKHLRVGINMALVETSMLGRLLIEKGVISQEEYQSALVVALELEVERYEKLLADRFGHQVTLA